MNRLNETTFKATFQAPMLRIGEDEKPPFDFWPYFEQIPAEDFEGFDCTEGHVNLVWRTADGRFEHVLVSTRDDADTYMVIVLDTNSNSVAGHRLLQLRKEYGID